MRLWSYLKLTVGQVALTALLIGGSAAAETADRFRPRRLSPARISPPRRSSSACVLTPTTPSTSSG